MICSFCNCGFAEIPITDKETLREVLICEECYKQITPEYKELTIQELERRKEEIIDNQIEDLIYEAKEIK